MQYSTANATGSTHISHKRGPLRSLISFSFSFCRALGFATELHH